MPKTKPSSKAFFTVEALHTDPFCSFQFDCNNGKCLLLSNRSDILHEVAFLTLYNQLDKLVGLSMLIAASIVFLYYTIWTLLMVQLFYSSSKLPLHANKCPSALCRLRPPAPKCLPPSRLGYSHSRHSNPPGFSHRRILLECGYDPKQSKTSSQGKGRWEEESIKVCVCGSCVGG